MRKASIFFVGLLVLFLIHSSSAQAPFYRMHPDKEAREVLETLRIWKLTRDVKIDSKQGETVFPKIQEIDEALNKHEENEASLFKELKELVESDEKNEEALQKVVETIQQERDNFQKKMDELRNELMSMLSVEQKARYLLFEQDFPRDVRRMLGRLKGERGSRQERREKRGNRHHRRWDDKEFSEEENSRRVEPPIRP